MIQPVYVSGTPPATYVASKPGSRVFRADVELQGIEPVDGVLKLTAAEVMLAPSK